MSSTYSQTALFLVAGVGHRHAACCELSARSTLAAELPATAVLGFSTYHPANFAHLNFAHNHSLGATSPCP